MDLGRPKSPRERASNATRRRYLRLAGGSGIAGLAGCTALSRSGPDEITVGYKPMFPFLQALLLDERGEFDRLSVDVETENFGESGLTIMQSFGRGDLDVAFVGITPAIVMQDRGLPGKVVAANNVEGFVFVGRDSFAERWADHEGPVAFDAFEEERGRPVEFATPPESSVAYVLLHHWLETMVGQPPADVDVTAMSGAGPVRQALVSGEADATCIMEPIRTILTRADAPISRLAWAGEFMSGQPGGVTVMHDRLRNDHPDLAAEFLELHEEATAFATENPDEAAEHVSNAIGSGTLPPEAAREALNSEAANFVTDPREIVDDTPLFCDGMADLERTEARIDAEDVFDFGPYDRL
ncbi:ABC transporter substrate-binding protein [Natrarchaeobius sp. A-rgal3]|uniref:ABC transporter substrate-binding protein n=1 Tax=Natrarchaeobius versutus TaxID=1679078 RepID=UPI003510BD44